MRISGAGRTAWFCFFKESLLHWLTQPLSCYRHTCISSSPPCQQEPQNLTMLCTASPTHQNTSSHLPLYRKASEHPYCWGTAQGTWGSHIQAQHSSSRRQSRWLLLPTQLTARGSVAAVERRPNHDSWKPGTFFVQRDSWGGQGSQSHLQVAC